MAQGLAVECSSLPIGGNDNLDGLFRRQEQLNKEINSLEESCGQLKQQQQRRQQLQDSRVTVTGSILSQQRRQLNLGVAVHDGEVRLRRRRSTVSHIIQVGGGFTNGSSMCSTGCIIMLEEVRSAMGCMGL